MNCCDDEKHSGEKNGGSKHGISHMLMMALCCGLPILLLLLLPSIGSLIPGSAPFISAIIPFLCPLMMVMMIPMMLKGRNDRASEKHCKTDVTEK
jgi:ACR3 family arsenite efflux pump ArsB